jgi:hypothetical protein
MAAAIGAVLTGVLNVLKFGLGSARTVASTASNSGLVSATTRSAGRIVGAPREFLQRYALVLSVAWGNKAVVPSIIQMILNLIFLIVTFLLFIVLLPVLKFLGDIVYPLLRAIGLRKKKNMSSNTVLRSIDLSFSILALAVKNFFAGWVRFMVKHAVLLLLLAAVGLFSYLLDTNIGMASEAYAQSVKLSVSATNLAFSVGNMAIAFSNGISPYTNAVAVSSMNIVVAIRNGANSDAGSDEAPPDPSEISRRALSSSEDTAVNVVQSFALFEVIQNYLTLAVIKVYLVLILPIQDRLIGALVGIVMRMGCMAVGQWCTLIEIFSSFLADLAVPFVWSIFGFFLGSPDATQNFFRGLACDASRLPGVDCICAGNFFSGSAGMFARLEPCNENPGGNFTSTATSRRALVSCYQTFDGAFVEEANGMSVHRAENRSLGCPTARNAFDPYLHAHDMTKWDVHSCITHCVNDVMFSSCDDGFNHTVSVLGSCGNSSITHDQALAKLEFLGVDLSLAQPFVSAPEKLRRVLAEEKSRQERVEELTMQNPVFYVQGLGECDLSRPPTSIYEILDDLRCLTMGHIRFPVIEDMHRRALESTPTKSSLFDAAHMLRKFRHLAKAAPHQITDVSHYGLSLLFMRNKKKSPSRRKLQSSPDTPLPCIGRVWCPQLHICVSDQAECDMPFEQKSVLTTITYAAEQTERTVDNVDVERSLLDVLACYEGYSTLPADQNPLAPVNIFTPMSVLEDPDSKFVYCPGMIRPTSFRFERIEYDARASVQSLCTGSPAFTGCACNFFFQRSTEKWWKGVLSLEFFESLLNGVLWFFLTLYLASNAVVVGTYYVYASATGAVRMPKWTRLPTDEYTYGELWLCWGLHIHDAATLCMFIIFLTGLVVSAFGFAHDLDMLLGDGDFVPSPEGSLVDHLRLLRSNPALRYTNLVKLKHEEYIKQNNLEKPFECFVDVDKEDPEWIRDDFKMLMKKQRLQVEFFDAKGNIVDTAGEAVRAKVSEKSKKALEDPSKRS